MTVTQEQRLAPGTVIDDTMSVRLSTPRRHGGEAGRAVLALVAWTRKAIWALLLACVLQPSEAGAQDDSDIVVHAERNGNQVVVDISMEVDATAAETWGVMTDYDRMAEFIPSLQLSRILSRDGNSLTVAQKGTASWGLIRFPFENVREIDLGPGYVVRSRMISGDMVSSNFVTRVVDRGPTSQLINHGEFVPKAWIPPLVGVPIIEAATRTQFQQFRDEVLRRKAKAAKSGGK